MISMNAANVPFRRPVIWKVSGQVLVPKLSPTVVLANTMNSRPASTSTPK